LALALAFPAAASPPRDAATHFFDASFGDLKDELRLARAEGKRGLLLMYSAEDCPPCHRMKKTVLSEPRVQDYVRRNFRVLEIDYNGDVEMADPQGRTMRSKDYAQNVARIRRTPTFTVVGLDGVELARHQGATRDAEEFLWLAEYVVRGEHRKKDYDAYRRERLAAGR